MVSHSRVEGWIYGSRIQSLWPCRMLWPSSMFSRSRRTPTSAGSASCCRSTSGSAPSRGGRCCPRPTSPTTPSAPRAAGMWRASLPALVGGLVLLYVVQAPLAYRMAVRPRAAQDERERLLVSSLAAAGRERGRTAVDLRRWVPAAEPDRHPARAALPGPAALWPACSRRWRAAVSRPCSTPRTCRRCPRTPRPWSTAWPRRPSATSSGTPTPTASASASRCAQAGPTGCSTSASATTAAASTPRRSPRRRGSVGLELLNAVVAGPGGVLTVESGSETGTTVVLDVRLAPARGRPLHRTGDGGRRSGRRTAARVRRRGPGHDPRDARRRPRAASPNWCRPRVRRTHSTPTWSPGGST